MRSLLALLALASLIGCAAAGDDDDSASPGVVYQLTPGDAVDAEPNDSVAAAQDLGVLTAPFSLTGSSLGCGENGTWDTADHDWFRFSPASGDPITLDLSMWEGDLDMAVLDSDGQLIVDGATAGLDDETLQIALDPEASWLLRIRCWQGKPGALWRLRLR
ncbi:MAG: PPC domain-containing protein [Deltaproteobacteria bacterium]|nr:PPC domain-containing protein [Deltaproteobacteria bacterium]